MVSLLRRDEPVLGSALARARLLEAPRGHLTLGFPEVTTASDRVLERRPEVDVWVARAVDPELTVEVVVGLAGGQAAVPSVAEVEERERRELLEQRRQRAKQHPLVQAVQLKLDARIEDVRVRKPRKEPKK